MNAFDAEIPLTRYVEGWGRLDDIGLVTLDVGHPVGAAWFRVFAATTPGYGFVDAQTPELTISVVPSMRRHGIGKSLLDALLDEARAAGHTAISLSVEVGSPAVGFYERSGFEHVRESDGGLVMRRRLV